MTKKTKKKGAKRAAAKKHKHPKKSAPKKKHPKKHAATHRPRTSLKHELRELMRGTR